MIHNYKLLRSLIKNCNLRFFFSKTESQPFHRKICALVQHRIKNYNVIIGTNNNTLFHFYFSLRVIEKLALILKRLCTTSIQNSIYNINDANNNELSTLFYF